METGTDGALERIANTDCGGKDRAASVPEKRRRRGPRRDDPRTARGSSRCAAMAIVGALFGLVACERPPPAEEPTSLQGQPVNVFSTVFFDQLCPRSHSIYEVPDGKLLIIEDASADAHDSATASIPGNPGIVEDTAIHLSIRTNPSGTDPMGSADHMIVAQRGLPAAGGRNMRGYAAPGSRVLFLIGGCTVRVNTNVQFSGRLIDYP